MRRKFEVSERYATETFVCLYVMLVHHRIPIGGCSMLRIDFRVCRMMIFSVDNLTTSAQCTSEAQRMSHMVVMGFSDSISKTSLLYELNNRWSSH